MNIKEPEKLKGINNSIHELNPERLLCKTDMMYLERMREIIKNLYSSMNLIVLTTVWTRWTE